MTSQASTLNLSDDLLLPVPAAARLVTQLLTRLEGGSIQIAYPSGLRSVVGHGPQVATLEVHAWEVFERMIAKGSMGFAEDFMAGLWRTDHLVALLTLLANNRAALGRAIHGNALRLLGYRLQHWLLRTNTREGSRRNIEAHYDLGNDFYALWLDETMSYSAARFSDPAMSLAEAQREKYRSLLRSLDVQPGQRILEIGCGWGGLAEVAVTEFECRVHGITLSPSQLAWAIKRAEQGGWADRASFALCDYRDLQGQFDHIVSIEMIEAVGERFWPDYFAKLHSCLAPGGRIGVQAITIANELFGHYRRDVDFIQRYIFPGGMLPSPQQVHAQAARAGLRVTGELCFGLDYARTLSLWHQRFNAQLEAVRAQAFDDRFVRMWQFYLAYCEAGFLAGNTDVVHYRFERV